MFMSPYACPSVPSLQPARSVEVSAHPLNTAEISLCRSSTSLHMSHGRGLGPEIILPENDVGTVVARSFIGPDSCLKMVPHSTYLSVDSRKSHPFPNTPFATECFYWHGCHMLCLPYIVQRSTLFPSFLRLNGSMSTEESLRHPQRSRRLIWRSCHVVLHG